MTPRVERYLDREPSTRRSSAKGTGLAVLVVVAALMMIVGTTFAGGDWPPGR